MSLVAAGLACILAGSLVYCVLVLLAVRGYLAQANGAPGEAIPISVLKPLAGADLGLEENLRSFFEQEYPDFEILLAVRSEQDSAVPVVQRLQAEFPAVRSRLIVTGEPPYPNAKVYSLDRMLAESAHEVVVMSDSDIRVERSFLHNVAAEFANPGIALSTCPYLGIGGPRFWSRLEAEGMNTEFLGGLLVARMIEGVRFAVGPTIVARKPVLEAIGGFDRLKDYLAEDFVMGKLAAELGFGVILSRNVVEHRIGSENWRSNAVHRLRWARSTRRSRPAGYVGQLFTNPLPIALLMVAVQPALWPVLIPTVLLRGAAAWSTSLTILGRMPNWGLLVAQDLLSFVFWIAGFFGNTVMWRGRRYYLRADGSFELAGERR
ncbi:MAG TPA: bacteriohopanetetrol glucosamine biosynthesis glycosyltransferase HpnI [Bryobacteraceae bacterium]|nr:bacteriohopanetetrol glucosamine biosynthesis glycosyltransferase HpnI [Bryobacteraceae bacterium]